MQRMLSFLLSLMLSVSFFSAEVFASDEPEDTLLPADERNAVIPQYIGIEDLKEEEIPPVEVLSENPAASATDADVISEEKPADLPIPNEDAIREEEPVPDEEYAELDGTAQVDSVTIWDGQMDGAVPIKLTYTEYYSKAFEVLEYINEVRADYGLYPLKMDTALMEAAMIRAGENTVWWEHQRANGERFSTTCSIAKVEILAKVYPTPQQAVNGWLNSPSHRTVVLTEKYKYIGIGCVNIEGNWFWTGLGSVNYYQLASESDYSDGSVTKTIYMSPSNMSGLFRFSVSGNLNGIYPGDTAQINARYYSDTYSYGFSPPVSGLTMYSTDLSVCKVDENGLITATGPGTASVVVYYPNYQAGASVFSIAVLGSTTVNITAPATPDTLTARLYPTTLDESTIRADMLKSSSSLALYTGSIGTLDTETPVTFKGLPYGDYKLAVHAKGGFIILVEDLSVDATYSTKSYSLWLYGDVNGSGFVDSVDALEVFNHSLGMSSILDSTPNAKQDALRRMAADVNLDSGITIRDVTQILRRANGLTSCFNTIP